MSALLDSLLDDERRVKCHINDGAMAMGRPIAASQTTTQAVGRSGSLNHYEVPAQSERFRTALAAAGEFG